MAARRVPYHPHALRKAQLQSRRSFRKRIGILERRGTNLGHEGRNGGLTNPRAGSGLSPLVAITFDPAMTSTKTSRSTCDGFRTETKYVLAAGNRSQQQPSERNKV